MNLILFLFIHKFKKLLVDNKNSIYFNFFVPEVIIDPNKYKNPTKIEPRFIYNMLYNLFIKEDSIFLGDTKIEIDNIILFESTDETISLGYQKEDTNQYIKDYGSESIESLQKREYYTLTFLYSKSFNFMTRKYMKFQDVIGNVSGFMELIFFQLNLIFYFYNQFRLDKFLSNKLINMNQLKDLKSKNIQRFLYELNNVNPKIESKNNNNFVYDIKDDKDIDISQIINNKISISERENILRLNKELTINLNKNQSEFVINDNNSDNNIDESIKKT